jgi:hypothetical protein
MGIVNLLAVEAVIRQEGVSTDRNRILYPAVVPVTACHLWKPALVTTTFTLVGSELDLARNKLVRASFGVRI